MQWSQVKGHELPTRILRRALERGRVSHAYLFLGAKGVGKATVARLVLQTLLCPDSDGHDPCGDCRTCRRVERQVHPDVHHVLPDGDVIRIEQIRELQNTLALKPFESARKGAIIDGADQMTTAAQNALLKTLEEPPGDTHIFLIAANPVGLLPTIRSRCQVLRFQPLPRDVVVSALLEEGVEEARAHLLASLTEGRLGEAIAAVDSDVIDQRNQVAQWVEELADPHNGLQVALKIGQALEENRDTVQDTLNIFQLWLRDVLLTKEGLLGNLANQDAQERLQLRASKSGTYGLTEALKAIEVARKNLQSNANLRLTLDVMLTKVQRSFHL